MGLGGGPGGPGRGRNVIRIYCLKKISIKKLAVKL